MLTKHFVSPIDAFTQFDDKNLGVLTYLQFSQLIMQLYGCAGLKPPTYSVVKDIFDLIDTKKDGIIDQKEWNQTFSPESTSQFENSPEYDLICAKIGKSRKVLLKHFEEVKVKDNFVVHSDAVQIL